LAFHGAKTFAVIFDFENQGGGFEIAGESRLLWRGMPRDIVEGFLEDAIDLNSCGCSHGIDSPDFS